MGQSQSGEQTIRVLNSAEAARRLEADADGYFYACRQCPLNSMAAQHVEPVAPPAWAEERLRAVQLPSWAPRELEVAFFREGLAHTRGSEAMHTRGGGPVAPHTRNGAAPVIWLPLDCPQLEKTFLHECIHISQRLRPDLWTKIYAAAWNMRPKDEKLPSEITARARLNPDTYGWPHFTFADTWTPVLVFLRQDAPRLKDVRLLFVNNAGGWQSATPSAWMQAFGIDTPSICEHPNEMAAYLLSDSQFNCKARDKLLETISRFM